MAAWSDKISQGTTATRQLRCTECRVLSDARAHGWRGSRCDEPYTDDSPAVAFYCPDCAEREFGAQHHH